MALRHEHPVPQRPAAASATDTAAVANTASTRRPRKSRGRGLRTTTGCAICRKRHMKCDEVKPICGPCGKGNRACVYYSESASNAPRRTSSITQPSPTDPEFAKPQHRSSVSSQRRPSVSSVVSTTASTTNTAGQTQWPDDNWTQSPVSNISNSTGYGTETAPLRWFGLLAGDAAEDVNLGSLDALSDVALSQRYSLHLDGNPLTSPISRSIPALSDRLPRQIPSKLSQTSAISPTTTNGTAADIDERRHWQAREPIQLREHEYYIFHRFVMGISTWIDLFDPLKHFSTFIPHLALQNQGLMKAVLALGARHLSIKPSAGSEVDRTAAVQYYYETLQYLQSAMQFTTYKNSAELLATTLVVSMYEMIDGTGQGWERHLKGVFWIQRSREINGESGGLEQAIWWAWLRQDVWAAFREHRRCFSFFKPTIPYHLMDVWDMARRATYLLAQCVNYASEEEKQHGETDLANRIMRANTLLNMLDEWRNSISIHFEPLPAEWSPQTAFRPIWVHPSAFGTSLQMHGMARILLLINQPSAGGYMEYLGRDKSIAECIDTIGGIALKLTDDASRLMSTQCLYAAGLYCSDASKQDCIAQLIEEHQGHTGWPVNADLAGELRAQWSKNKPG